MSSAARTRSVSSGQSVSPRGSVSSVRNSRSAQVKLLQALALDQSTDSTHHGLSKHIFHWPQRNNNKHGEVANHNQTQTKIVVEKRFVKNHHTVHQPGGHANCNTY